MKLWEWVIEFGLRVETNGLENQFGFMPGRSTAEANFLIRLIKRYRGHKKNLFNDVLLIFRRHIIEC